MANNKQAETGAAGGRYAGIPYRVLSTKQFTSLSGNAVKMLLDLLWQYTGRNNGALSPSWALMRKRGWKSSGTLYTVKTELLYAGFIVVTRQGSKRRGNPTLVAITWNGIDECYKVELDEGVEPTHTPLSYWCKARECWKPCYQPKKKIE